MGARWLKEVLFVCGFAGILWFMIPEENLPAPLRRLPPEPPPVVLAKPPPPATPRVVPEPLPPAASAVVTRRLPPPSANDPVIDIAATPARSGDSIGTAFAIDRGTWGTARHVTRDCGRVFVHMGARWVAAGEVRMHAAADVAVLKTERNGGPAFAPSDRPLFLRQDGYHVGYPKGQPASIRSALIGRTLVQWPGAPRPEPTLTWVELARENDFEGELGGISGGPVLDAEGRLIGITIASSVRRKRITTSLVESLREIAPPLPPPGAGQARIEPAAFGTEAARLRRADSVTMVYCQFDAGRPAPRRQRLPG